MFSRKFRIFLSILFLNLIAFNLGYASEVKVKQQENGDWLLLVDNAPYFIKGVSYTITKVGQSPDGGYIFEDWAYYDYNKNGKIDGPYDAWVDKNKNNQQDEDEPSIGDFQLLKEMGCNTMRWYHNGFKNQLVNKQLFRNLFAKYGIRLAVGDFLGAYCIGSEAPWNEGTDYRNETQQKRMIESVKKMVLENKDEPYVLMWLLGNENNLGFTNTNAIKYPEEYAKFLNRVANIIHKLDPKHPVALVNGDAKLIKYYAQFAPDIDIIGSNVYRGPSGFGSLWKEVKEIYNKPILITEYGGSYGNGYNEDFQVEYHKGCWQDLIKHKAGAGGSGNYIGGMAFEWLDRWWTAGEPDKHATKESMGYQGIGNAPWDLEWSGVCSQGDGKKSPFTRQLRKLYFMYKELWNKN